MGQTGRPRLFIDSAAVEDWLDLWPLGLFQGITTNPTLLRRAGVPCTLDALASLVARAAELGCQEIQAQAWGASGAELLACGKALLSLSPERVVVKLPLTEAAFPAAKTLLASGAKVTLTACYATSQVLAAAALGCTYVAPYLGRIKEGGGDGIAEVLAMQGCLRGLGCPTRLLVASLRSPEELAPLAAAGVDSFTLSPALARQLWSHRATADAVARFERDASG